MRPSLWRSAINSVDIEPWQCIKSLSDRQHISDLRTKFLVCRLDKLLSWFSTQTFVVNFRYYLFCLCNVRRQYLLLGILGIYCFLTSVLSLPAIALPKGRICSLINQVYTSFPLMSLPPFGLHWPNVGWMLCHHLWHSSNIEPTLCQGIELPVFPAKMRPLANAVLQLGQQ